jgi:cation diffusion facilitator family transporter
VFRNVPKIEALAMLLSLSVGCILLVIKFTAYFLTDSAAIFADAVESIVNVLASAFALYAVMLAHKPPDQDHPYGHGKAEFLSAAFEGGMIVIAAVAMIIKAGNSFWNIMQHGGEVASGMDWAVGLMVFALLVNFAVGGMLVRIGKKRGALTLEADGWHLLTDVITSVAALGALLVVRIWHIYWIDPVVAAVVALYVAWMGLRLVGRAQRGLMDEQDDADNQAIIHLLHSHMGEQGSSPRISSFHKVKHRHVGRYHWVDFHVQLPADMTIMEGHHLTSLLEVEIEQLLGDCTATAHVEPWQDGQQVRIRGFSKSAVKTNPSLL